MIRLRVLAALVTVATAAAVLVIGPASPATADVRRYRLIQNQNTPMCLEITYGSKADFARAGQYTCYGGPIQQWSYDTVRGSIMNENSKKCLEVLHYSTAEFAPVGQYTCHGGPNQKWHFHMSTGELINHHSGKCLEVLHYSTANFAPVGQYTCHGGRNQKWWW